MLFSFLALALVLAVQVSPVFADKKVTVKPLDHSAWDRIAFGSRTVPACIVGNTNAPYWIIEDFLIPPEQYKLAFHPSHEGCNQSCSPPTWWGFKVITIHIILQVAESCTVTVAADIEEAIYSGGLDCPEPSVPACGTNTQQILLGSPGVWDISLPVNCDCLGLNKKYFIGLYIESYSNAGGTVPNLVVDVGPATTCANYNNYGTGWSDLKTLYPNWPGNLVFFADAECCELPVPTEQKSWGSIKKLYEK